MSVKMWKNHQRRQNLRETYISSFLRYSVNKGFLSCSMLSHYMLLIFNAQLIVSFHLRLIAQNWKDMIFRYDCRHSAIWSGILCLKLHYLSVVLSCSSYESSFQDHHGYTFLDVLERVGLKFFTPDTDLSYHHSPMKKSIIWPFSFSNPSAVGYQSTSELFSLLSTNQVAMRIFRVYIWKKVVSAHVCRYLKWAGMSSITCLRCGLYIIQALPQMVLWNPAILKV